MNETPKTKLTIDDLVEAQQQTARSLKAIEEHLESLSNRENLKTNNEWAVTIYVIGCLLSFVVMGLASSQAKYSEKSEKIVYVGSTLIEVFILAFVGFYAVRYFAADSASRQRTGRSVDNKQSAIDAEVDRQMLNPFRRPTPPTSSW